MNRISALLLACIFTPQILAAQVRLPSGALDSVPWYWL